MSDQEKTTDNFTVTNDWGAITFPAPMKCNYCDNDAAFFIQREWAICADCFRKVFDFFFTDWSFRTFFSQLRISSPVPDTVITVSPRQHKCRYFQEEFCSLYDSECNLRIGVKFCEGFEE